VGFPIRTSWDQRVLSPPPSLSQSATSFIASCCQGIHQTPFSRLIRSRRRQALLRDGGSYPSTHLLGFCSEVISTHAPCLGRGGRRQRAQRSRTIRRPSRSVYFDLERLSLLVFAPTTRKGEPFLVTATDQSAPHSGRTQERLVYYSLNDVTCLISRSDSAGRLVTSWAIRSNHLSPSGEMVGRGGVEPPTSRLSGVRSNHLSYRP
jgi:hypothetical protein